MRLRLEEPGTFQQAALKGEAAELGVRKTFAAEVRAVERRERVLEFTISTGSIDRDDDVIDPKGWDLGWWKQNPVVLFAHSHREPPVARGIDIRMSKGQLISIAEFTPADLYPFGHMIFRMYEKGFMRATSVGFRPLEWERSEDEKRRGGIDFRKQELLEYSTVPVPANQEALLRAHAAGIDTAPLKAWAERALDCNEPLRGLGTNDLQHAWSLLSKDRFFIDLGSTATVYPGEGSAQATAQPAADCDVTSDVSFECCAGWEGVVRGMRALLLGEVERESEEQLYAHVATHYESAGKNAPELRFVTAHVLRALPEFFELDAESGELRNVDPAEATINEAVRHLRAAQGIHGDRAAKLRGAIDDWLESDGQHPAYRHPKRPEPDYIEIAESEPVPAELRSVRSQEDDVKLELDFDLREALNEAIEQKVRRVLGRAD